MSNGTITLSPESVEAVAQRVAELIATDTPANGDRELIDPSSLARRLGKSRGWVYEHADELGAIRVGEGERPRLMFDPATVREKLAARSAKPRRSKPKRRPGRRRSSTDADLLPIGGKRL